MDFLHSINSVYQCRDSLKYLGKHVAKKPNSYSEFFIGFHSMKINRFLNSFEKLMIEVCSQSIFLQSYTN